MTYLSTKYMGLELRNPLIAGSSGITDNKENIMRLEKAGSGAMVLPFLNVCSLLNISEVILLTRPD